MQRNFCHVTRDFVRVFYFVFVKSMQSKKRLATSRVYLIIPLCLKFYVCSRFVYGPLSRINIIITPCKSYYFIITLSKWQMKYEEKVKAKKIVSRRYRKKY